MLFTEYRLKTLGSGDWVLRDGKLAVLSAVKRRKVLAAHRAAGWCAVSDVLGLVRSDVFLNLSFRATPWKCRCLVSMVVKTSSSAGRE
jgi:hypothetical protein